MPRVQILVPSRSPSEVIARIAEQTAGPDVNELLDPVRYHGTPSPTGAFELRRYDWRPGRGGRARFKTNYRIVVSARGGGTAVDLASVTSARLLLFHAIGSVPLVLLLVALPRLLAGPRGELLAAIAAAVLFAAFFWWALRSSLRRSLEAERVFLAGWLGGT